MVNHVVDRSKLYPSSESFHFIANFFKGFSVLQVDNRLIEGRELSNAD